MDIEVCPYRGRVAFSPGDARWFFGRERVISDLISRVGDRLAGDGWLAVVAPSGAGKSSLLAAGLIPALADGALPGSEAWLVVATTPGTHPLANLVAQVDRVVQRARVDLRDAVAAGADPERFAALLAATVAAYDGRRGKTPSSARVVLIVDQFEEIFTECREETERRAFIAALNAAAHGAAVLVVLGMRADFYHRCLTYPELLPAFQARMVLGPMAPHELRAIITGPAADVGLQVEPGLVELLLRDVGVTDDRASEAAGYNPGVLPLLAHALFATWQQRDGGMLTVAGYLRTGGIREALATTAERTYMALHPDQQYIAQQILLRLVRVDETGYVLRRIPLDRLLQTRPVSAEATEMVLQIFGRARLLTFDAGDDADSVEIAHDALVRAWPRLANWISTDRAGLRIHQALSEDAERWWTEGRDPFLLYRGSRLDIARDWADDHIAQLSPLENDYLKASSVKKKPSQRVKPERSERPELPKNVTILDITEEGEEVEVLKEVEEHLFDNSMSTATAAHTIRITNRRAISLVVDIDKTRTVDGGLSVTFGGLNTQGKMEHALRERFALTYETELTHEQTAVFNIPAQTSVRVTIEWKRVWQLGKIHLGSAGKPVATVPYRVTRKLRFNSALVDVVT
jgi:hypothetical protein